MIKDNMSKVFVTYESETDKFVVVAYSQDGEMMENGITIIPDPISLQIFLDARHKDDLIVMPFDVMKKVLTFTALFAVTHAPEFESMSHREEIMRKIKRDNRDN